MDFRYTAVISLKGIHLRDLEDPADVIVDPASGMQATLTSNVDEIVLDGARGPAIGFLMLKGVNFATHEGMEAIEREAADIAKERIRGLADGVFLVVVWEDQLDEPSLEHRTDFDDFAVCYGAAGVSGGSGGYRSRLDALVTALASELQIVAAKHVIDFAKYWDENGKRVFLYELIGGRARVYTSPPATLQQLDRVAKLYHRLCGDAEMKTVARLIRSSFQHDGDDVLRAFLSTWFSFEVFVNKMFRIYKPKPKPSTNLPEGGHPLSRNSLVFRSFLTLRLRCDAFVNKMLRIYEPKGTTFADRFSVITDQLASGAINEDWTIASGAKKVRDRLLHGEEVDEDSLPIERLREIVLKYVRLRLADHRLD